jgi:hypothetical protein
LGLLGARRSRFPEQGYALARRGFAVTGKPDEEDSDMARNEVWLCSSSERCGRPRHRGNLAALVLASLAAWAMQAAAAPPGAQASESPQLALGGETPLLAADNLTAPPPAQASSTERAAAAPAASAAPVSPPAEQSQPPAASWLNDLSLHAYINQAYAISKYHQLFGIPTTGTTDYRTVAVQIRYAMTKSDSIVTQFISFREGDSAINQLHSDVELELGFYQHLFADATAVKVGKMQLPLGIYNEIRDVGTLLPFYAPPNNIYLETNTARSLEGVMVSRTLGKDSAWSLDTDLYGGGWRRLEEETATGQLADARVENAVGTQIWLNTPVAGLRLGGSYAHFDIEHDIHQVDPLDPSWVFAFSLDASFERFYVRSEMIESGLPDTIAPGVITPRLTYRAYYGQAGYYLTRKLSINLQADFGAYNVGLGNSGFMNLNTDYGVSLVYKFRPNLVAKVEAHRDRGSLVENVPSTSNTRTNYGIASLAASF